MSGSTGGFRNVEPDDSNASDSAPNGAPGSGLDAAGTQGSYPDTATFRVQNCYLSNIDGPAVHVGGDTASADVVVDNVHIDGASYGVIADGITVTVRNCEIRADQPFGTVNGGSIEQENTNTGSDANPSPPGAVPTSAQEAASSETQPPS